MKKTILLVYGSSIFIGPIVLSLAFAIAAGIGVKYGIFYNLTFGLPFLGITTACFSLINIFLLWILRKLKPNIETALAKKRTYIFVPYLLMSLITLWGGYWLSRPENQFKNYRTLD